MSAQDHALERRNAANSRARSDETTSWPTSPILERVLDFLLLEAEFGSIRRRLSPASVHLGEDMIFVEGR
jgi:hypothetical protein